MSCECMNIQGCCMSCERGLLCRGLGECGGVLMGRYVKVMQSEKKTETPDVSEIF